MIHDSAYVTKIREICEKGGGILDFGDTVANKHSYHVALLAAGGVLSAADAIHEGKVDSAFAAVRPPGHHAEKDRAMGFCLFNNVAIGAAYLMNKLGYGKIVVVDWDVHHGNGTQHAFQDSDSVFYFSLHQFPHYPGTGAENETGVGKGEGYTLNVPMRSGSGDAEYLDAFREKLLPRMESFRPDFILVSAGFDAHGEDPLSSICLTDRGYREMTRLLKEMGRRYSTGGVLSVLEGGYNIEILPVSVREHILELIA